MTVAASTKHFISLKDLSKSEIIQLVDRAIEIRRIQHSNIPMPPFLKQKTLAMLFTKPSTRTRISSESGWANYGGHPLFLGKNDLQLGKGEPLSVTAKVTSSMVDCILARVGGHDEIETIAANSRVPVINALTSKYHPLQILADLVTIKEQFGKLEGLTVAWIGDSNNIVNSMLVSFPKLGINFRVCTPAKYPIEKDVLDIAQSDDSSKVFITNDPLEAVNGCDIIVTDTWVSMGQEEEKQQRLTDFEGFQVIKID